MNQKKQLIDAKENMLKNETLKKANKIHTKIYQDDEFEHLMFKTMEEMAELQVEFCKSTNISLTIGLLVGNEIREKIIREIIDVQICLDKMLQYYKVNNNEYDSILDEKAQKYLNKMKEIKQQIDDEND